MNSNASKTREQSAKEPGRTRSLPQIVKPSLEDHGWETDRLLTKASLKFLKQMTPVRQEDSGNAEERLAIREVNEAAFGGPDEADLVDALRAGEHALLSLVAVFEDRIVGHTMFSRMWIDTSSMLVSAVALAPVAVMPEQQRKGIGGLLIWHGLELLRERGERIVIVLGHSHYYPRFGFSCDKARPLRSPFPPEAFMALELSAGALDGIEGAVIYPPPFGIASI